MVFPSGFRRQKWLMNVFWQQGKIEGGYGNWLFIPVFAGQECRAIRFLEEALQRLLTAIVDRGDFLGRVEEVLPVLLDSSSPAPRVLLVGLDAAANADRATLRQCGELAAHRLAAKPN